MKRVRVDLGERGYDVLVGAGVRSEAATVLAGRARVALVSQDVVARAHAAPLREAFERAGIEHETFLIGDGEEHKSLATVEVLCRGFAAGGLLRGDAVVALGGGVVGDVAGFAAAAYHRGVDVLQVPTTLLAMVDSAIGGKTGVNLPEGKNLVGAFHQPRAVLADPDTLVTLPEREYRCGLGEVAKYALLGDADLVDLLRVGVGALLARDPGVVADVVTRCAAAKARVVEADEFERTGRRAVLNYGHTLAHALETAGGYGLLHGEAVAVGLVFAARLSEVLERVGPAEVDRHVGLVAALGLPTEAPPGLNADDVLAVMRRDKKSAGELTFVLAGAGVVERVVVADVTPVRRALAAVGIVG